MNHHHLSGLTAAGLCLLPALSPAAAAVPGIPESCTDKGKKMNILLIMADDMRPELGCYGVRAVRTPNIDRLAGSGMLFHRAYCNVPVSGASRASMLTGVYPRYPDRFVHYAARASRDCPEAVPLSAWFKAHGYHTVSDGKVFHHLDDHASSWSEPPFRSHPDGYDSYWAEYNRWELWQNKASARSVNPANGRGPFCEWAEVPDTAYEDGKLALKAVADLERLKDRQEPFFLACGFWKPHLPFNAPRRYWDLYRREDLPRPDNRYRPEGLPAQVRNSGEIFSYAGTTTADDPDFQQAVRHGYYACLSYVDAQVGKVLDALDSLGLAENTVVVFLGDHGWLLGEHNFLGKHNLMEEATRIPLIVRIPGMPRGQTEALVELVDLYPTLCSLCGLPEPEDQLDGTSFLPVLHNPDAVTKDHVFIQWAGGDNAVSSRYSYAEWRKGGRLLSRMLFDHRKDPGENRNRAELDGYKDVARTLSGLIRSRKEKIRKTPSHS